jgi:hypothetical protein
MLVPMAESADSFTGVSQPMQMGGEDIYAELSNFCTLVIIIIKIINIIIIRIIIIVIKIIIIMIISIISIMIISYQRLFGYILKTYTSFANFASNADYGGGKSANITPPACTR